MDDTWNKLDAHMRIKEPFYNQGNFIKEALKFLCEEIDTIKSTQNRGDNE